MLAGGVVARHVPGRFSACRTSRSNSSTRRPATPPSCWSEVTSKFRCCGRSTKMALPLQPPALLHVFQYQHIGSTLGILHLMVSYHLLRLLAYFTIALDDNSSTVCRQLNPSFDVPRNSSTVCRQLSPSFDVQRSSSTVCRYLNPPI